MQGAGGGAKPPQAEIFELLRGAGRNLAEAAELIDELLRSWPDERGLREQITRREHEGDRLTHKVVNSLRLSKITPPLVNGFRRGSDHDCHVALRDRRTGTGTLARGSLRSRP